MGDFQARVTEVDGMRISRVLLTRIQSGESRSNGAEEAEPEERANNGREQ